MKIRITDLLVEEVIFTGETENFLFENDNDEELEVFLSNFESSKKIEVKYYSECGQPYLIEKVLELIYD